MNDTDLAKEIEEDLQRERVANLWNSFGKAMVLVSLVIILVTIIVVIRQDRLQAYQAEQTAQFIKGNEHFNIEDYKGAVAAFDALDDDPFSSYYGLAKLRKAQAQTALGDKAGAAKTYTELATHDSPFRGLGKLHSDAVITPDKASPFYYTELEWRGWQLMQQGKKDEATTTFSTIIQDSKAPQSQRGRLQAVLQYAAPEKLAATGVVHE